MIVAVPAATPVTVPALTVAILVLLLDQLTFLFVALDGEIVGISVTVLPTLIVSEFELNETLVTAIGVTVIEVVAVVVPFAVCAVAVIVALPWATPVTKPVLETVAIDSLLDEYVTFLTLVSAGVYPTVNCVVAPIEIEFDSALKEIAVGYVGVVDPPPLPPVSE